MLQDKRNQDALQAAEYRFPYHFIPEIGDRYKFSRSWSFSASYVAALQLIVDEIQFLKQRTSVESILDYGCGDGALLYYLSNSYDFADDELLGIDIDEAALEWARLFSPRLKFSHPRELDADFKGSIVCLIEVLEHIPIKQVPDFVAGVASRTAAGGYLILTVPTVHKPLEDKHYQHFTEAMLVEILSKDFDVKKTCGFERASGLTRFYQRMRSNQRVRIEADILNRWEAQRLARPFEDLSGCGRVFVLAQKRI